MLSAIITLLPLIIGLFIGVTIYNAVQEPTRKAIRSDIERRVKNAR